MPPAVSVDAALIDCDSQVAIIVLWDLSPTKQVRIIDFFPIDGFSVDAALASFQAFANEHPELGRAVREARAKYEAADVSGILEKEPLALDPADPLDADLMKMQSLEELNGDHH